MTKLALEKDVILKRLAGIESELSELEELKTLNFDEFAGGDGWKLTQFHLHRALEGVFNICSHISSRIPGTQATQYKELALKLGEVGIVSNDYAEKKLVQMAKYRNRLVHFYAQITKQELFDLLQHNLGDFDLFLTSVKNLLAHPEKFNLVAE